jgi:hypothetical protein
VKIVDTKYPPGFFLELVRLHNFPPGWVSQIVEPNWSSADRKAAGARSREAALAKGDTGTIHGISRKADEQVRVMRASARAKS